MKFNTLVRGLFVAGLVTPVIAQQTQRIEITGSSIKRVQSEGALPVQVIKRADIERLGITSAEQLLMTITANGTGAASTCASDRQALRFHPSSGFYRLAAAPACS